MARVNDIVQMCWIVRDLHEAMPRFQKLMGCGPFYWVAGAQPAECVYRGQPTIQISDLALGQCGSLQVELIQPLTPAPGVYREVVPEGQEGLHHMCYFSDDYDAEKAHYLAQGCAQVFECVSNGDMRVAYYDTRNTLGCMTEVLEENAGVRKMFAMIKNAAEGWDGSDPIRELVV